MSFLTLICPSYTPAQSTYFKNGFRSAATHIRGLNTFKASILSLLGHNNYSILKNVKMYLKYSFTERSI